MKPTPKYASKPTSDDPRDVEAWALAEAARRLIDAARDPNDKDALRAALQLNQRLWTIFQAAMTEEDCGHPEEVKTNVAALSLLVDRETLARLADLDGSKIELLVNINRQVASGLTQRPVAPATPAPAQTPVAAAPVRPLPPSAPAAVEPPAQREPLRISI